MCEPGRLCGGTDGMASRGAAFAGIGGFRRGSAARSRDRRRATRDFGLVGAETIRSDRSSSTLLSGSRSALCIRFGWSRSLPGQGRRLILIEAAESWSIPGTSVFRKCQLAGSSRSAAASWTCFRGSRPCQCALSLDDEVVDSIRNFDPDTQISISEATSCENLGGKFDAKLAPLRKLSSERRPDHRSGR